MAFLVPQSGIGNCILAFAKTKVCIALQKLLWANHHFIIAVIMLLTNEDMSINSINRNLQIPKTTVRRRILSISN